MPTRSPSSLRPRPQHAPAGAFSTPLFAALCLALQACNGTPLTATQAQAAPAPAAPIAAASGGGGARELSEAEAQARLPRAIFSGLNGEQRASLVELAGDTFDYAGCVSTLAACLRAEVKDKHAPRMARLAAQFLQDGLPTSQTIFVLEGYYASFAKAKRKTLRSDDCGSFGDPKAPVVLVEYSDYQCPHCATALKPLHDLVDRFKGKVRLCSKYFPLPGHARALAAAGAAEFARSKGKFWEMNELLFAHQEELEDGHLKAYARQLGLDGDALLADIQSGKYNELIERHRREGAEAGVRSTPSVYLNGRLLNLPVKPEYLAHSVDDELEWLKNGGAWDKE